MTAGKQSFALPLFLLFITLLAWSAAAADIAGKIQGAVSDSSGAFVAGASVVARNTGTGVETGVVSTANGSYSFESLLPASYTVTCELAGFKKFVATDIRVTAQQTSTLNISLSVGAVSDSVEVSAAATQVDTVSPTVQNTLGQASLMTLPVTGRDPRLTAELALPGTVSAETESNGQTRVRFNGARGSVNNYKIDGTESIDYFHGTAHPFPAAENLAEFTVQSSTSGAQAGNGAGGQVTAVIKSGTNAVHGMGWAYLTNSGWNANSWQNNMVNAPRPREVRRWYGGNVGGPVYIPHLYNGKNRTFFFFSYEYTKPSIERSMRLRVLTDAERRGDFGNSNQGIPKLDGVATPRLDPATFSPLAKALLANTTLLPTSSDPNAVYTWNAAESEATRPFLLKVDQNFASNHRLFVTLFWYKQLKQMDSVEASNLGTYNHLPNEGTSTHNKSYQAWTFNYTYTISPTLVNNVAVGVKRSQRALAHQGNPGLAWDKLGMPQMRADTGGSLDQSIVQVGSGVNGFVLFGGYDDLMHENAVYAADNLYWVKGRHTVQAGFDFRIPNESKLQNWYADGAFGFSAYNNGSTGNPFADFLLGRGASFSQISVMNLKLKYPARQLYFQDQVRVSRKLTATLGIRWEPHFGISEAQQKLSGFRPGQQSVLFPNAPLGMVVPGDPGVDPATYPNRYRNFAPRVGLAYDLFGNGKMAIRAGYGIFYDFEYMKTYNNYGSSAPYGYSYYPLTPVSLADPYGGVQIFPYPVPTPGSDAAKNYKFPATAMSLLSISPDFNSGRTHQWNVSYEWEPVKSYLVSAGYVSTRGTNLQSTQDLNTPIFIPNASTSANRQARRPYPQFGSISEWFAGSTSRYSAMQLTLNKRFGRGFGVLATYSLSRNTDDGDALGGGGYRDVRRRYLDYGISSYDRPQILTAAYNWDLPFPSQANKWLKVALGNWTWGGTLRASSGAPVTIPSPSSFNVGSASAWANYLGGSVYGDRSSRAAQASSWLNVSAFCQANASGPNCTVDPKAGVEYLALGNSTRGIARAPGSFSNNMTLAKRFPFSERWSNIEVRLAAFNVFNHTMLGTPDTNIASPKTFGRITSAAAPRSLQLAIRYMF